jgi:hypothetical protein
MVWRFSMAVRCIKKRVRRERRLPIATTAQWLPTLKAAQAGKTSPFFETGDGSSASKREIALSGWVAVPLAAGHKSAVPRVAAVPGWCGGHAGGHTFKYPPVRVGRELDTFPHPCTSCSRYTA